MNQKINFPYWLIIILLAAFAVGYLAWMESLNYESGIMNYGSLSTRHPSDDSLGDTLSEVEGWKTYRNEEYGFEFGYPKDFALEEVRDYKGNPFVFRLSAPDKDPLYIEFQKNFGEYQNSSEYLNFKEFAVAKAKVACDADGHIGATYCESASQIHPVAINSFNGFEIYLQEIHENYVNKTKTERIKGPIYALDVSGIKQGFARGVFFNRGGYFENKHELNQILSTFRFIE